MCFEIRDMDMRAFFSSIGGQIFNIEDQHTGILYREDHELKDIIIDISKDKARYIRMGKSAKTFYENHRKPSDMVAGMSAAIDCVLSL